MRLGRLTVERLWFPRLVAHCSLLITLLFGGSAFAAELSLQELIDEALKNSPEILATEAKWKASGFRVPQAASLPDPMFMFGYQNDGFDGYTFGEMEDSMWMFSASQMFPFPGKLGLKKEMAARDSEGLLSAFEGSRHRIVARVKELYFDLFLAYKDIDLLRDKVGLFSRIEEAAVARYSSGVGMQQEVLMAQTEKYMLLEREEMLKQKIEAIGAMLNTTIGRDVSAPLGRPGELSPSPMAGGLDELVRTAYEHSPDVKAREKMIGAAEAKLKMAKKEFYPDFTLNATYYAKGEAFQDMWSFTTTLNIPLFYRTKQRQAVYEAEASVNEAMYDREAVKLMIASEVSDNYTMAKTGERLMELYRDGLIPKTYQDFEAALAGYQTGRIETITVINRLKSLIDFEALYWAQLVGREKAIARLGAVTGTAGEIRGQEK